MTDFLWNRPETPPVATLLLAHGAGAAMDSTFMNKLAAALASQGIAAARFEFAYMAGRRTGGPKKPPPRADKLIAEFQTALQSVLSQSDGPLLIGGKSMGGRVAAMLAGGGSLPGRAKGVACFGYPFHPTGKADAEWRLQPLQDAKRPVLVLQGDRDPFGSKAELDEVTLPAHVSLTYLEDGNHDFGPRGKSPATLDGNIKLAAEAVRAFVDRLTS
ncbi:alpha/beta hydrolase [Labrenzia sp. PO1]|uniref:alpha/beta family hydrolase n=1 Tax=Stappiaceae TaxID=2821832 RepID=UPI0003B8A41F|nr:MULTISPECIES: alpha/beta family hydrolase [Stappiaceae]ERP88406.1 histidine kinase [Labrenzia sp. C1B10]ERP99649.1 histidine kinase [Labrenzia sp. C1B70]MBO6858215.1 alpha/beta hydrolase [Roseibium sp.]NKI58571.1 alpha/beta hydrolase [Labrenzia sp. PO1]